MMHRLSQNQPMGRVPRGTRGLKRSISGELTHRSMSRPAWDAGIETLGRNYPGRTGKSRPAWDAGIETLGRNYPGRTGKGRVPRGTRGLKLNELPGRWE